MPSLHFVKKSKSPLFKGNLLKGFKKFDLKRRVAVKAEAVIKGYFGTVGPRLIGPVGTEDFSPLSQDYL